MAGSVLLLSLLEDKSPSEISLEASTMALVGSNSFLPISTTPEALITHYAKEYNYNPKKALAIAWCESRYDQKAIGKSGEVGIYQWLARSFYHYAQKYNEPGLDIFSAEDNIRLAIMTMADNGEYNWVCWKKLYLKSYASK